MRAVLLVGSAGLTASPCPVQVQRLLDDESAFPTRPDAPFPPDFRQTVSQIFRRLFRVYAHTYHNHYERMVGLAFLPHLNTCFKHFMCVSQPATALGLGGWSVLGKWLASWPGTLAPAPSHCRWVNSMPSFGQFTF